MVGQPFKSIVNSTENVSYERYIVSRQCVSEAVHKSGKKISFESEATEELELLFSTLSGELEMD
jgi:hypothetical protein